MNPMMSPANPAGARPSTAAPKTVNTRIAVPMTSAVKPTGMPALAFTDDRAETQLRRVVARQDDQRQAGADERPDQLGDDVAAGGPASILRVAEQGDGHGGVDVAAADVPDRIDRGEDRERERERDRR